METKTPLPPTPPPSTTNSTDSVARAKKIQKQLVIFFHAYKCLDNDQLNKEAIQCQLKHCATLKKIILHLQICRNGNCTVKNCIATRTILSHWDRCVDEMCLACGPLKKAQSRMETDPNTGKIGSSFLGNLKFDANTSALGVDADPDMTISGNVTINIENTPEPTAANNVSIVESKKPKRKTAITIDPWDDFLVKLNEFNEGILDNAAQVNYQLPD